MKLRRWNGGYTHWCPGCKEHHFIRTENGPLQWAFDGNIEAPTFTPSVRITGKQTVIVDGEWTGEWVRGPDGKALDMCCHYFLQKGQLVFLDDSTHELAGKTVPLVEKLS